MKLSGLKLGFCVSLLVHGTVFSAVYVFRHAGVKAGMDSGASQQDRTLEIIVGHADAIEAAPETVPLPPALAVPAPEVADVAPQPMLPIAEVANQETEFAAVPLAPDEASKAAAPVESVTARPAFDLTAHEGAPEIPVVSAASDAGYLLNPRPLYPREARKRKEQGRVVVEVVVTAEGLPEVVEVKQSSGFSLLDRSATDAIRHWRFTAARNDLQAVSSRVEIPIRFKLSD